KVIVFGRKGERFFSKLAGIDLLATFDDIADAPNVNVFSAAMEIITSSLERNEIGKVVIIYTQFVSSLVHKAAPFQLIPIDLSDNLADTGDTTTRVYEFEPEASD